MPCYDAGSASRDRATDRFLVLSVCPWETKTQEEPHTSAPFSATLTRKSVIC